MKLANFSLSSWQLCVEKEEFRDESTSLSGFSVVVQNTIKMVEFERSLSDGVACKLSHIRQRGVVEDGG